MSDATHFIFKKTNIFKGTFNLGVSEKTSTFAALKITLGSYNG